MAHTAQESPVSYFASGARGSRTADNPHLHAMIWSFFDDSSDAKRQEYFAVGGLLDSEEQWINFEPGWREATEKLKESFRSTDCETQNGQFADWSKPECDALMTQLVDLLVESKIGGFASVVPISDFQAVFPALGSTAPYLLVAEHTIVNMAHLAAGVEDEVELWFELGTAPESDFHRIYNRLKNAECWEDRLRLWAIHFADKRLIQLQAADLVAREAFKHFQNQGIRRIRKPFERLQSRIGFLLWNREILEHVRERNWPDNPEALACWSETEDNPARPDFFYVQSK